MNSEELKTTAEALKRLFNSFPSSGLVDVDGQAEAYLRAVKDADVADVLSAIERFCQGEVSDFSGAFCPSTAQLCQEVRVRRRMRELRESPRQKVVPLRPTSFLANYMPATRTGQE